MSITLVIIISLWDQKNIFTVLLPPGSTSRRRSSLTADRDESSYMKPTLLSCDHVLIHWGKSFSGRSRAGDRDRSSWTLVTPWPGGFVWDKVTQRSIVLKIILMSCSCLVHNQVNPAWIQSTRVRPTVPWIHMKATQNQSCQIEQMQHKHQHQHQPVLLQQHS